MTKESKKVTCSENRETQGPIEQDVQEKMQALRSDIVRFESAALAFSGGVDSALLAYVAAQELGDKFIAVTLQSALMKEADVSEATRFCDTYGIRHVLIDMDILADECFVANDQDRCYHCKVAIFSAVRECADQHNLSHVMDGTNIEDCPNRRPGMRVLREQGIRSPLRENLFTKEDIRTVSKQMKLFTWDKVSDSCLATRVPQGQHITADELDRLRRFED
ncbi:MAG: ATP-dependent sacrificial sulfur transferase LarE [Coriobacteriia bacterium]|nr:ATP-dependent sacrificial sulfur transferase LarE [Coriobacteriia bacterium]MCL2871089.1 ATP-dependent sacrificial sulfur transferase LarE [Coriobacteriia bacterium]